MEDEARPLWFPEDQIPFSHVDSSKALAAGLTFRPSYDTARDTLRWLVANSHEVKAGFTPEEEAKLSNDWLGTQP